MDAWILATLLVYLLGNFVGASKPKAPEVVCPKYLPEGEDLACECQRVSLDSTCKTYWLGRADGPRLQKPNVTRDDNGTRFTCETDCTGHKSSTDYTLQVAYGPSEGSVSVQGPTSYLVDGNQTMTLTCVPGDVNPAPSFKWRNNANLRCENGDTENTCVLIPKHFYHGKSFSCRVGNGETDTAVVTADFTVNLTYPPPMLPLLSGYTKGTPLKPGDILQCTVTGGNPPVSTVYLNCSDQAFPCQSITTGDSRVTSCQLDFKEDKRDTEEIQCSCSAVWGPDPQLYVHVATDTIKVWIPVEHGLQDPQTQTGADTGAGTGFIGLIIGVISGLISIAIAVFVIVVLWRRNHKRKYDKYDTECAQSLNKVAFLPLPPPIGEDDTSSDTTQPEDVETDFGYSTLPGSRESIPLSSAKSVSERDVEEPAGMSGDYSTVLEEIKGGVKTPVKVLAHDTSNGYTEVQLDTPPAEPEPPNPTVTLHDVVDISQLDLPKPEVCLPTSHFASFRISQSTTKYRGPLGDQYTLVDKKKGRCLPMVHEDNNGELDDTVEPDHKCNTEPDTMKNPQAENCDDGTYEKLHHGSKPTPRVAKPDQVYSHILIAPLSLFTIGSLASLSNGQRSFERSLSIDPTILT